MGENIQTRNPFEERQRFESTLSVKVFVFVVVSAVAVVALWAFFLYRPYIFDTYAVSFEESPLYEESAGSVRLKNIEGSDSCDVFVSGPSKEIKYYNTFKCSELSSTLVSKSAFSSLSGLGTYSLIVFSEQTKSGYDESFEIK